MYNGEIVVWRNGRLDWDRLLRRGGSPARGAEQVRQAPASFVAFDLLAEGQRDLRQLPWSARRGRRQNEGCYQKPSTPERSRAGKPASRCSA